MERRYLTVFIIILVISLVAGIAANAILDIGNRGQIKSAVRNTFELIKANKAEQFVREMMLDYSMIYGDSPQRERPLVQLYAKLNAMEEIKSVSVQSVKDRVGCLAVLECRSREGKDETLYLRLFKYQDRWGNRKWLPLLLVETKKQREETLKQLRAEVAPRKELARRLEELAGKIELPDVARKVRELVPLAEGTEKKEKQEEFVKKVDAILEAITASETVTGLKEALKLASEDSPKLADKLKSIAGKAEHPGLKSLIEPLVQLAGKKDKKEELEKGLKKALTKAGMPEATGELNMAKGLATADGKESAKRQAQGVLAGYQNQVQGQIAGSLGMLTPRGQIKQQMLGAAKQAIGQVEIPELGEGIDFEKAVEAALPKVRLIAEKLKEIADKVELKEAVDPIHLLHPLATSLDREKKEEFYEKLAGLTAKVNIPELSGKVREAVIIAKKSLAEELSKLSDNTKDPKLQGISKKLAAAAESLDPERETWFLKTLTELPGNVKALKILKELEEIRGLERRMSLRISRKLYFLAGRVDTPDIADAIKELSKLAADKNKAEEFDAGLDRVIARVASTDFAGMLEEALDRATEGNEQLIDMLKKLDELTESSQLAGKVEGLLGQFFSGNPGFEDTLREVCLELISSKDAGRLAKTDLGRKAYEVLKLAEDEAIDPLNAFNPVTKPKGACARLIERLKRIGKSDDPEKEMSSVLRTAGMVARGLGGANAMWSQYKTPYAWHYMQAAGSLAESAPSDELREEAEKLAGAARNADMWKSGPEDLPGLSTLAEKIKAALLEETRVHREQLKALGAFGVKNLGNDDAGAMFIKCCELASMLPGVDGMKLAESYAELSCLPTERKLGVSGAAENLISNEDTLASWAESLRLGDNEIRQEYFMALGQVLELKSMPELADMLVKTEDEQLMLLCETILENSLKEINENIDDYIEKDGKEKARLAGELGSIIKEARKLESTEPGLWEFVEGISADALDGSDLHESHVTTLQRTARFEVNRRGGVKASMRKQIEELVGSFPPEWAFRKGEEAYLKWAFPGGTPTAQTTGLSERKFNRLLEYQKDFAGRMTGSRSAIDITHHWYPDPDSGFSDEDTGRLSEIVRIRIQTNPGVEEGEEEYTTNDFMLIQEMDPDWSVEWKLYRVCNLYEYSKCWEIAEKEFEKRKAYFKDGEAR